MEKRDFQFCQICGAPLGKVEYDSSIYCDKCIIEMEKKNLTPEELSKRKRK